MKQWCYLAVISLCFTACNNHRAAIFMATGAVQVDNNPGACPYLTKDNMGNTVLSWVRMINDSTTAFCYAVSGDGKTFSAPVVVPNSGNIEPHGENLPKIIFKPGGEVMALWGAGNANPRNKYSGLVFYTQSFDHGKTWTAVQPLVSDTAGYDQRYYDVALLQNGEIGIIWLDNRKTIYKEGSALYFASTNGKNGFGDGRLISQPCCPCCRTDLYVDQKGGIHAIFRGIIQDSIRDMVHMLSADGGKTFSEPKRIHNDNWVISGCPHTGPAMAENQQGMHFAWFTGGSNKGCFYTKTTDDGKSFVAPDSISVLGSHPQLTALRDGNLVIVWDENHISNNKMNKRIGIQTRDAAGNAAGRDYLTEEGSNASYPVISASTGTSSIVAYSNKIGDKDYVAYKVVTLN